MIGWWQIGRENETTQREGIKLLAPSVETP